MSTTQTITPARLEPTSPAFAGPVEATINFMKVPEKGETPYNYVEPQTDGRAQTNIIPDTHKVTINDIRTQPPNHFRLDTHAFELHTTHSSPAVDFSSDASITQTYYPEVEQLLKDKIPHTHKVVIFDHTVRRQDPAAKRSPVLRAHIDQTAASALARVPLHVPDSAEAERLLAGRVRIVNVWRPINGAVESIPLAVADSTSVPDANLHAVEHRYPGRTGETAGVSFAEGTRWWYAGNMRADERLLLQCSDSKSGARVPHTAFVDPRTTEASRPRESIEVRALVFGSD